MKIGTLAKAVGCHVETVRYYERIGLIPKASRLPNGYGEYSGAHLQCLKLIRHAKHLGFSQLQIRELVKLSTSQINQCSEVQRITLEQLELVEGRLRSLHKIKQSLTEFAATCKSNQRDECPVLGQLITKNN